MRVREKVNADNEGGREGFLLTRGGMDQMCDRQAGKRIETMKNVVAGDQTMPLFAYGRRN